MIYKIVYFTLSLLFFGVGLLWLVYIKLFKWQKIYYIYVCLSWIAMIFNIIFFVYYYLI